MASFVFQSHLYGIESTLRRGLRSTYGSFNRTFMELKGHFRLHKRGQPAFQSHLYGIESRIPYLIVYVNVVSIAPLWNWKRDKTTASLTVIMFQSHLYGIESFGVFNRYTETPVSIAPLWNWKRSCPYSLDYVGEFQSHLYGIERIVDGRHPIPR